jgi:LDH2 family malate/lactate/ureidoglycolate dehydrogenase
MNIPPDSYLSVAPDDLRDFAGRLGRAAGLPGERADLLAELLTANDLRGVVSHGTRQLATYARLLRDGILNPEPAVQPARETSTSLLMDGDGGLGYFPAYEGTGRVIDKALDAGIAVLVTRNHGHFGAAAYTFEEPPLVLDFGAMHDLYDGSSRDLIAEIAPGLVHRSIGMGMVCQSWGGFRAGVPLDPARADRHWPGANQGSMVIAMRIDLFTDPAAFKAEMDAYARAVRDLTPIPGAGGSYLPGGVEAEKEAAYRADGIPVGAEHQEQLGTVAAEFGVTVPWN